MTKTIRISKSKKVPRISLYNQLRHWYRHVFRQYTVITLGEYNMRLPSHIAEDFQKKISEILLVADLMGMEIIPEYRGVHNVAGIHVEFDHLEYRICKSRILYSEEYNEGIVIDLKISSRNKTIKRIYCHVIGHVGENNDLKDYVSRTEHLYPLDWIKSTLVNSL